MSEKINKLDYMIDMFEDETLIYFDESIRDIVSRREFIDFISVAIIKIKDKFISNKINSLEWEFYEFPWFTASLPKKNWNSEDVIGTEVEFLREVTTWFIKAQAIALYEDNLESFYNELFNKYEFSNN